MPQNKVITYIFPDKSKCSYLFASLFCTHPSKYASRDFECQLASSQYLTFHILPCHHRFLLLWRPGYTHPQKYTRLGRKMICGSLLYLSCDTDCHLDMSKSHLHIMMIYNKTNRCGNIKAMAVIV